LFEKSTGGQCRDSDTGVGFFCFSQFHREQITIDSSRVSGNISRGDKGIAGMEANGKKSKAKESREKFFSGCTKKPKWVFFFFFQKIATGKKVIVSEGLKPP
jgi:hypothetical protein